MTGEPGNRGVAMSENTIVPRGPYLYMNITISLYILENFCRLSKKGNYFQLNVFD
jgi:hypothetical protein